MPYSQHGEEGLIAECFGSHVGRFLDIGAFDGRTFSNTRALLDVGWSGVMVEPNPRSFLRLMAEVEQYPVICLSAAIMPAPGVPLMYVRANGDEHDAASTMKVELRDKWETKEQLPFRTIRVLSITLAELLGHLPGPYDFVSIDIEGMDGPVMERAPIELLGAKLICIEQPDHPEASHNAFLGAGYGLMETVGDNVFYLRR